MFDHAHIIQISKSLPRTSLPSYTHTSIDASLKELKSLSRRLTSLAPSFRHELQILERLYYKGKNQHRSSLFWRRVVEIRKLGRRVNDLSLERLVERLWASFLTTENHVTSKKLRNAWTRVPDKDTCGKVLKRIQSACDLLDQSRARFQTAYRLFTLQIQTAMFLPLSVSLVAITSRLDFILAEMRLAMPPLSDVVMKVVKAINMPSDLGESAILVSPQPDGSGHSGEMASNGPSKTTESAAETLVDFESKIEGDMTMTLPSKHVLDQTQPFTKRKRKEVEALKRRKRDEIDDIFGLMERSGS